MSKSPKNFPAKMRVDLAKFAIKLKLDLMTRIRRNIAIFKANKYVKRHEGKDNSSPSPSYNIVF